MVNFAGVRLSIRELPLPDPEDEVYTVIGWVNGDANAAVYERVAYEDWHASQASADLYMSRERFPFGTVRSYTRQVENPLEAMRSLIAYRLITHNILRQETDAGRGV
jgi:hypothetical protein